jgi:hypothetical protein
VSSAKISLFLVPPHLLPHPLKIPTGSRLLMFLPPFFILTHVKGPLVKYLHPMLSFQHCFSGIFIGTTVCCVLLLSTVVVFSYSLHPGALQAERSRVIQNLGRLLLTIWGENALHGRLPRRVMEVGEPNTRSLHRVKSDKMRGASP